MVNESVTREVLESYDFRKLFKSKGYVYFSNGLYNLNIIGIRTNKTNLVTNLFDDYLVVIYNSAIKNGDHVTSRRIYPITTEPGLYYMNKPMNVKGAAILVPNQYRGAYRMDYYKGYQALVQNRPVKVYRDNNKDNIYDLNPETIEEGMFGLNIHKSNDYKIAEKVNKWSAGCQVFSNPIDFKSFMTLCEKQKDNYGNSFTYTLLDEKDLV